MTLLYHSKKVNCIFVCRISLSCNLKHGLHVPFSDINLLWYLLSNLYIQMQGLSQRRQQEDVGCMVSQSPDDIQSIISKFLAKVLVIVHLYLQPEHVKDNLLDITNKLPNGLRAKWSWQGVEEVTWIRPVQDGSNLLNSSPV